jgi:hypothetical protein
MKVQMHTFFERLDTAGQKPTVIDRELAAATVALASGNLREAQKHVTAAHAATGELGEALAAVEAWGKAVPAEADLDPLPSTPSEPPPPPAAPPGMRVADVAEAAGSSDAGPYDGPVNPTTLTLANWGYYAAHNLGAQSGHIFDRPFVIGDPFTGRTYTEGDLANAERDADPQIPGGVSLAQWG